MSTPLRLTTPRLAISADAAHTLVALLCAGSAGVHAALIADHLDESVPLGVGFAASAVALALAALMVRRPRHDPRTLVAAAVVLLVVAVAYALSRTIGVPLLISTPEHLDALGLTTTVAEVVGAAVLIHLLHNRRKPT